MKYEMIFRRNSDWCLQEQKIIDQTIDFINNPGTGNRIVEIGRYLNRIAAVKYLLIGKMLQPEREKVRTLCFFHYQEQLPDITYALKHTPCYGVLTHHICYYPTGIQREFPLDPDLAKMGVDSYLGTALNDAAENPIGLIVLLNDKPLENAGLIEHLITMVSPALEEQLSLLQDKTNW